ncbi:MAG: hypothetical protein JKY01_13280 [Pseudomonadales bacterium]|nr:hypothetical protein [Pseudomonadales bacterium]
MIKVLIERRVIPELDDLYRKLSKDTLLEAGKVPGFVTGEALKDCHNSTYYYVISTWKSEVFWNKWLHSEQRKYLSAQIRHVLERDESYTLLQPAV